MQGDKTGDVPLVEEVRQYLKERYNKPGNVFCGLVHRIDRPVSGAVIFAKTSKALARMNELVKERHISKIYWALVEKAPEVPEQKLVDYVKKDERTNKTAVSPTPKPGYVEAELAYRVVRTLTHYTLLEVELYTGRHHQIRAQLALAGMHIVNDRLYGAFAVENQRGHCLHALGAKFRHPATDDPVDIRTSYPAWAEI